MTITTSAMVSSKVNCTSEIEARMVSVRSPKMESFTDDGSVARKRGNNAFTRSTV